MTRAAFWDNIQAMIPDLPNLTGDSGTWMLVALKAIAATGFMTAANVVILYAC